MKALHVLSMNSMRYTALFILLLTLGTGCFEAGTEYSNDDVPAKFHLIQRGDSRNSVYQKLGSPIFVRVNPDVAGDGAGRQETLGPDETNRMEELMVSTNVAVFLHYSQAKKPSEWNYYKLYVVSLRNGRVVEKDGPQYMD